MRRWSARLCGIGLMAVALSGAVSGAFSHAAMAQKNPGTTIPTSPPPASVAQPAYRPPPQAAPAPTPAPMPPPSARAPGGDPAAEALANRLPLPPATRDLTNQLPADIAGTERRLGLRRPQGPATDMRGRVPTTEEIVNALAPRRASR